MTIDESFDCPICHEKTCSRCYDREHGSCLKCHAVQINEIETAYKEALARVCANGAIGLAERRELIAVQKKLGMTSARAMELERAFKTSVHVDDSALTSFEVFTLEKAKSKLYEEGNPNVTVEMVRPIYEKHKLDEAVVSVYVSALAVTDANKASEIVSGLQVDILGVYLTAVDMALRADDMNVAEERLLTAENMWAESNLVKCRRCYFLHKMFTATGDETFLADAGNVMSEFGEPQSRLERSWMFLIQNLISQAFGDSVPTVTEALCIENDLYYPIASGRLLV